MKKFYATATWKVKRAHTSMTRSIVIEAPSREEAMLRARAELSQFITRNKAEFSIGEIVSSEGASE